ncbi:LOW QUALITY PROTEIN: uncharacterized protein LOC117832809 [Xyrichtys novacula]|uniref:LOW QUALITY PROTEIN: uncharacterized protein LOC117832809 n=1 Tax=Xyrichtys novacula TaxID=13765 RepID=A0AAV1GPA6_XYRNO|nr:LOW QUALITY PROTEIN: uncharacterized protein LOC117832809 [Xyrichtys novacula]
MAERQPEESSTLLLSAVKQAIKSCKAEQAKINNTIQLYRGLLQTLTPQPKTKDADCAEHAAADTDASSGEREDIELLERALEKALRVRTGTLPSKKDPDRIQVPTHLREPATSVVTCKDRKQTPAVSKVNPTSRLSAKSASLDRKELKKPVISSKASRQLQRGVSASGSQGQLHSSPPRSKNKSDTLSGSKVGKAAAKSAPSSNNTVSVSHAGESVASGTPPQSGIASDQTVKWKSLRRKQNRLWDRVVAVQRKPVPGRSHYMERMRAMFPEDWPRSCPDQTRAKVDRLTHQGLDLAQQYQMNECLAQQVPAAAATELGGEKDKYDSRLTPEKLQRRAAELQVCAEQTKKEWEAWDRWRPEGGCLCPSGVSGVWGDGIIAPLPLTVTYTSESELREVEKLRIRVALLEQEIHLEQALLDTISPQLLSTIPGPGCPNISMLRDMYSLLGEGGERFPSVVLDTEPD